MLASPGEVIMALLRYTDWWQPTTSSVIQVGAARRSSSFGDGVPLGLLSTLDERTELCRRMQALDQVDRDILFLWYVKQLAAKDIASAKRVSRRQVFRRRLRAVRKIVELGEQSDPD
jgi:DNA-directed RNA polymerase specialized sigma24 family protein